MATDDDYLSHVSRAMGVAAYTYDEAHDNPQGQTFGRVLAFLFVVVSTYTLLCGVLIGYLVWGAG